ncbi:DUF1294 domain-containing protein [Rhodoferax sp. TBRC 17660]|uniref:DUF1294 domain-containing protein n=1 Tax=Rhodoferax potami TaxID=3068338 RepID=A0ABU3KSM2_9BURK|nr:DUF1294 domain-containing protein [Rhodoferax sp. TBRC 17660]MDT7520488.1 DUF1294 domain-containing protein [Rhodoferax sp. TBRC 17660]
MKQLTAATLAALWAAGLGWGIYQHRLPPLVLGLALALNAATFGAYWLDKRAARARHWRIQEKTLHLLALVGGWPAARLAQQVLRHKTVKPGFQAMYWLTVWVHLAGLGAYVLWDRIKPLLNS